MFIPRSPKVVDPMESSQLPSQCFGCFYGIYGHNSDQNDVDLDVDAWAGEHQGTRRMKICQVMAYYTPKGKGKGIGKGKFKQAAVPTRDYQYNLEERDYNDQDRERRIQERHNRDISRLKGHCKSLANIEKTTGPLWTSHLPAADVLGTIKVSKEKGVPDEVLLANLHLEPGETEHSLGDLIPSDAQDPRRRSYAWKNLEIMERLRQERLAGRVYAPEERCPELHPPQQQRYPEYHYPYQEQRQPQMPPQQQQEGNRQPRTAGSLLQICATFDGRLYGPEYLVLAKRDLVLWLREEENWAYGEKVGPVDEKGADARVGPRQGWFPPAFGKLT
ncbi:unnamed protein product [Durusdinium trenchii]|uniref:SH3 domain-containing protein n=1 Tax=Durusdinium trenchii TaxID=1381693 RepID=A0ABP0NDT6_9DINO